MTPKLVHSHLKYIQPDFGQKIDFFLFLPIFSVAPFLALGFYPLLERYSNFTVISIYNVIHTKKNFSLDWALLKGF